MKTREQIGREWAVTNGKAVYQIAGEESTLCGWGSVNGAAGNPQPSDLPDDIFQRLTGPFASKTGENAAFYHSADDAYADLGLAVAFRETQDMAILRGLVIEMRRYVKHHGILIGECVAWEELKKLTSVGQDHDCPSEK
jgi:hypothetical protein